MRPLLPAQRIRRWHTYLVVWTVHRVLGLGAALLLILLSFTGSLLVVHHDVERWLGAPYRLPEKAIPAAHLPWNDLLHQTATVAPEGYRAFRLLPGHAPDETVKVLWLAPDGRTRWAALVDPRDGELLWHGADQSLLTPWLLGLHMNLHLGPWGYAITGLAGVALLALGCTGLYLHRDDLLALRRRAPLRLGRGWRALLHDIHTWTGALSLYFSIVLGATGVAFAILILPGQLKPRPEPGPAFALEALAPLEAIVIQAKQGLPGHELLRISLPSSAQAPVRVLLLDRRAPVWAKFSTADFEATTGTLLRWRPGREASTKEKWRALVGPLHFGFYGAGWVKGLYVLGGLAPGVLAMTGIGLWWRRMLRLRRANAHPSGPRRLTRGSPRLPGVAAGTKVNR